MSACFCVCWSGWLLVELTALPDDSSMTPLRVVTVKPVGTTTIGGSLGAWFGGIAFFAFRRFFAMVQYACNEHWAQRCMDVMSKQHDIEVKWLRVILAQAHSELLPFKYETTSAEPALLSPFLGSHSTFSIIHKNNATMGTSTACVSSFRISVCE